eukprot:TRINITY_DN8625_c0_g1_i2.p1 TRINITY_DN8625_c0_g1~~TRINITY_DN8625_c0_g1_i2.p1  ORF type:complete len:883 (+),score=186.81 TRINITY_DN8625_c0_g1_i2:246-2894(+)
MQGLGRSAQLRQELAEHRGKALAFEEGPSQSEGIESLLEALVLVPPPTYCKDAELDVTLKPLEVPVRPSLGRLSRTVLELLDAMNADATAAGLDPKPLFSEIGQRAPRFRGYQQQDSQELLRHLLDGMDMEERQGIEDALLAQFGLTKQDNQSFGAAIATLDDKQLQKALRVYHRSAKTLVQRVFGGKLASTVTCNHCHHVSRTSEDFLDLSLPITTGGAGQATSATSSVRGLNEGLTTLERRPSHTKGKAKSQTQAAVSVDSPLSKKQRRKQEQAAKREARKQRKLARVKRANAVQASEAPSSIAPDGDEDGSDEDGEKDMDTASVDTWALGTRNPLYDDTESAEPAPDNADKSTAFGFDGPASPFADGMTPTMNGYNGETSVLQPASSVISLPGACDNHDSYDLSQPPLSAPILSAPSPNRYVVDVDAVLSQPSEPSTPWSEPTSPSRRISTIEYDPATGGLTVDLPRDIDDAWSGAEDGASLAPSSLASTRPLTPTGQAAAPPATLEPEVVVHQVDDLVKRVIQSALADLTHQQCTSPTLFGDQDSADHSLPDASGLNDVFVNPADDSLAVPSSPSIVNTGNRFNTRNLLAPGTMSLPTTRQHSRSNSVVSGGNLSLNEMILTPNTTDTPLERGTAVPMYVPGPNELSLQACLARFCSMDTLKGDNTYMCHNCGRLQAKLADQSQLTATNQCILEESEDEEADSADTKDKDDDDGDSENKSVSSLATEKLASLVQPGPVERPPDAIKPVAREASKQMLIESVPPVLTIHLKRFQQTGMRLSKNTKHVSFPVVLDLAPFCVANCAVTVYDRENYGIQYKLNAVVVHQGRLNYGHYIAYVRTTDEQGEDVWHYASDSSVRRVTLKEVLNCQAYILFYERLY